MEQTVDKIKSFLQYVVVRLVEHPEKAELRIAKTADNTVRFRLILQDNDVPLVIGKKGSMIGALRNVINTVLSPEDGRIVLQVVSEQELSDEQ